MCGASKEGDWKQVIGIRIRCSTHNKLQLKMGYDPDETKMICKIITDSGKLSEKGGLGVLIYLITES